jgi:hypothetical protein
MYHGTRRAMVYRGSRARLRRIRLRGNGSPQLLWFVVMVIVLALLLIARLTRSRDGSETRPGRLIQDRHAGVDSGRP